MTFGREYTEINNEDIKIIKHAAQSILINDGETWQKKNGNSLFDITMGGYHGAELCELIGLFILDGISKFIPKMNVGLYRDDGLAVIQKNKRQLAENTKKQIHKYAASIGLKLTIENPVPKTDFLDLNLNLIDHSYAPFRKPNSNLRYVSNYSIHPNNILKQIPNMIENRLSKNSSSECEFNKVVQDYNKAIKANGYNHQLTYQEDNSPKTNKTRKRNSIWFNPPFCKTVKTKVGRI